MENYANNFVTALAAPVGLADPTIAVLTSAGSPDAQFRIVIDAEYLLVTNKVGNTWTVTRGVEGSAAAAHSATYTDALGAVKPTEVAHVLTVAGLKALVDTQVLIKNNVQFKPVNFSFGDAPNIAFVIPANAVVLKITVNIIQSFNGTNAVFKLGTLLNNSLLVDPQQVDLAASTKFEIDPNINFTSNTDIYLFITPGAGATQGAGWLTLEYATFN